jgi:hypothetical protein
MDGADSSAVPVVAVRDLRDGGIVIVLEAELQRTANDTFLSQLPTVEMTTTNLDDVVEEQDSSEPTMAPPKQKKTVRAIRC